MKCLQILAFCHKKVKPHLFGFFFNQHAIDNGHCHPRLPILCAAKVPCEVVYWQKDKKQTISPGTFGAQKKIGNLGWQWPRPIDTKLFVAWCLLQVENQTCSWNFCLQSVLFEWACPCLPLSAPCGAQYGSQKKNKLIGVVPIEGRNSSYMFDSLPP